MDFLLQSPSHLPRWVRSVYITRSRISHAWAPLKVHNLFGSEIEFCTISLLALLKYKDFVKKIFDWAMNGGDTIVRLV
jgi:hypothetical protein